MTALKSLTITDLYQGVSSQPEWRRQPGQVDDALNIFFDIIEGAARRPATDLLGNISTSILDPTVDYQFTTLREFRIFLTDDDIKIIDDNGNSIEIINNTDENDFSYLSGASKEDIETTSSIDTLVINNRTKMVTSSATPDYTITDATTVQLFSDLPAVDKAMTNDKYKVVLDENLDPAGHYNFNGTAWVRIAAPADPDGRIDKATLPHRLIYDETNNRFDYDYLEVNDRFSGNSKTNPVPPYVNGKIRSVQFHSGRLILVGEDSVNSTRASDIFTLFVNNVNIEDEADRISIDLNLSNIGKPLKSASLGPDLFIACENGQVVFSSGDQQLTSVNGRPRVISDAKSQDIRPAVNGNQLVMLDQFNNFISFQWTGLVSGVQEIGRLDRHVQEAIEDVTFTDLYIDGNTMYSIASDGTVWVTGTEALNNQIIKLDWSKFSFYHNAKYIDTWQDKVRIATADSTDGWAILKYVHRKPAIPTGFQYSPYLDRRELKSGSYDADADETTFVHLGSDASLANSLVALTDGRFLAPIRVKANRFTVQGQIFGNVYVGFRYSSSLTFSDLWDSNRRVHVGTLSIFHKDSTNYDVEIGRQGTTLNVKHWDASDLSILSRGDLVVETGMIDCLVGGDSRQLEVKVSSNSAAPFIISQIAWRARRM